MKNKAVDLNNHLFSQLERLSDETIQGDDLKMEMDRTRTVAVISKQIIDNHRNIIEVEKMRLDFPGKRLPELLTDGGTS